MEDDRYPVNSFVCGRDSVYPPPGSPEVFRAAAVYVGKLLDTVASQVRNYVLGQIQCVYDRLLIIDIIHLDSSPPHRVNGSSNGENNHAV